MPARPNTTYSVSAWVQGTPVYLGVTGGSCTWTSASAYSQLSLSFTTTANQTSAGLYLHGWHGAGTYDADDLVLDGPGGDTPDAPGIPGAPTVGTVTDTSIALNWAQPQAPSPATVSTKTTSCAPPSSARRFACARP
ncbi:hypothetical protein GCM10027360_93230 [Amycolatopsis echigonensis]